MNNPQFGPNLALRSIRTQEARRQCVVRNVELLAGLGSGRKHQGPGGQADQTEIDGGPSGMPRMDALVPLSFREQGLDGAVVHPVPALSRGCPRRGAVHTSAALQASCLKPKKRFPGAQQKT
jgi:hypothetical protein